MYIYSWIFHEINNPAIGVPPSYGTPPFLCLRVTSHRFDFPMTGCSKNEEPIRIDPPSRCRICFGIPWLEGSMVMGGTPLWLDGLFSENPQLEIRMITIGVALSMEIPMIFDGWSGMTFFPIGSDHGPGKLGMRDTRSWPAPYLCLGAPKRQLDWFIHSNNTTIYGCLWQIYRSSFCAFESKSQLGHHRCITMSWEFWRADVSWKRASFTGCQRPPGFP